MQKNVKYKIRNFFTALLDNKELYYGSLTLAKIAMVFLAVVSFFGIALLFIGRALLNGFMSLTSNIFNYIVNSVLNSINIF